MAIKYNDLYMDLRRRLREAGAEDATQAARELVCTASGKTKNELLRDGLLYASPEVERSAYSLCARHLAGEPVAYLIGEWEFYGLGLDISPAVLIPRPDTEVLVQTGSSTSWTPARTAVCSTCARAAAASGLAVASQVLRSRVLLGEWDEEALKVCRQNIRRNQLSARVTSLRMDAREKPSRQLGEFDCIVSNPPYIPTADIETLDPSVRDHEPHLALDGGADGLDFYRVIADKWRDALLPNGLMAFEVGIGQADEVLRIMRANGFGDIQIVKDLHGIPRVVYGRLCKEI